MFINTLGRDSFLIRNNTTASIQVVMMVGESRVEVVQPSQQVIQPGHCGAFELKLSSKLPGHYKSISKYVINGKHTFELMLTANFIPIGLETSTKNLHISIDDGDTSFSKSECFQLKNEGNKPVSFSFGSLLKFEAIPREGEIQPQSCLEIKVVYTPICHDSDLVSNVTDEDQLRCIV